MIKKICGSLIIAGLSSQALAASSVTVCKLDVKTPATVGTLDTCWNERETIANQKIIAQYLEANPTLASDYDINWRVARLVSFIGNYGYEYKSYTTSERGQKLFSYGATAAKAAMNLQNTHVEGAFWYAVDLGSYDVAKGGSAGLSDRKNWLNAATLANTNDATYDYYGSNRMLAVYYQVLPGLFGGSNDKALAYLTEATTKAATFKYNWIALGQYYLNTKDYKQAITNCTKGLNMVNIDGSYEGKKYNKDAKDCINTATQKMN